MIQDGDLAKACLIVWQILAAVTAAASADDGGDGGNDDEIFRVRSVVAASNAPGAKRARKHGLNGSRSLIKKPPHIGAYRVWTTYRHLSGKSGVPTLEYENATAKQLTGQVEGVWDLQSLSSDKRSKNFSIFRAEIHLGSSLGQAQAATLLNLS